MNKQQHPDFSIHNVQLPTVHVCMTFQPSRPHSFQENSDKNFKCLTTERKMKPEDNWSCIAHLSAEDMLKSVVIEEKKFEHSPRVGADNPFGPTF